MCKIADLLKRDKRRLEVLHIVRQLDLPDCLVAAGFVRNMVWDVLHSKNTPLNDIDVVFYDRHDKGNLIEQDVMAFLKKAYPDKNWEVKNQAFMHSRNGDLPYRSTVHAMSCWPEKETAIGAVIDYQGSISVVSAFGVDSLLNGELSYNPKRAIGVFEDRVKKKGWLETWPKLRLVLQHANN